MNDKEYKDLQRRIEADIVRDQTRQKAIRAKREERKSVKKAGGGREIAKAMGKSNGADTDTDFSFGHNEPQPDIDTRIAEDYNKRCMERVQCSCGQSHGFCAEILEDREKLKMLPTGNEPTGGRGNRRPGGMEWLKNEDLSTTPKEAKILMVRYNKEGRFGARVEMKLAFDSGIKYFGVPPKTDGKNENYKLLTGRFGHDENEWVDQRILLFLEQDQFSGQYFVRVDFPKADGPVEQRRTRATSNR
jgi:hypothetical protein